MAEKTIYQESIEFHRKFKGKISIEPKFPLKSRKEMSLAYTPGVAEPCREIAKDKSKAYEYTLKNNTVAIFSDGSRVLGLGNLGAYGAIPVMEGKAYLFKVFAGIDAFPICVDTQDKDKLIETAKLIAPVFGGINLEDIESPKCYEVEEALQNIGIPVMHDDQHGTAVACVAGLLNAVKVTGKQWKDLRIVIAGAGAAGLAIAKLLLAFGRHDAQYKAREITLCDSKGAIYKGRDNRSNPWQEEVADLTNPYKKKMTLKEAMKGADIFLGVASPNLITAADVATMNKDAIVFAMANPVPEIMPDEAKKGGALIIGTGRSDFPNQVNNSLAFPGIFRGALDVRATRITQKMKIAAALAIASCVKKPTKDKIIPDPLDKGVAQAVAKAVGDAWKNG